MNLINRLINKKNDDYYTVSNDASILNEKQIVNDKPGRRFNNGFTKFMINMLSIVIWILLTCVIFCPIVIVAYYNQNNISGLAHIMCPIILVLVLLFMFITDKVNIITNHILDKLENDDDTVNSETKKDDTDTLEDKYNNSINDSNNRMGSAIAIGFMIIMALMIA